VARKDKKYALYHVDFGEFAFLRHWLVALASLAMFTSAPNYDSGAGMVIVGIFIPCVWIGIVIVQHFERKKNAAEKKQT